MATAPVTMADHTKLSFADIVASGGKENAPLAMTPRVAVPVMEHRRLPTSTPTGTVKESARIIPRGLAGSVIPTDTSTPHIPACNDGTPSGQEDLTAAPHVDKVVQGLQDLDIATSACVGPTPSLVINGTSTATGEPQTKNGSGTSLSDDISQRADSNSENGAKALSLDGKSVTSGTTCALDEKESLRPDDSASVMAAPEDDDGFSVRGTQIPASRIGSDIARVHRLRIGDMPSRIIQILPEQSDRGIETLPGGDFAGPQAPAENPPVAATVSGATDAFTTMYAQYPDEKLIEAMSSPKDRLFLLRLEQEVVHFVEASKEPYMDLPPNNSFCRMLTHKLADYYHMTHSFEAVQGSVRIYRTPFCRVPQSLASIVSTTAESNTDAPPPALLPKKIMRRGEDDGSGHASGNYSKGTSEVGSDGKLKGGKEKLTREQREEAYNKARQRIFAESEKTAENEDTNGMSRASSVSAMDQSNTGKRAKSGKKRRDPESESFESRSSYTVCFGNPYQPAWTPQFIPTGYSQIPGQGQAPYQTPMAQGYAQSPYPHMMPQPANGYQQYGAMPAYPSHPQYLQSLSPPRYPSNGSMPGYGSPMPSMPPPQGVPPMTSTPTQQGWPQASFHQTTSPGSVPFQHQIRGLQAQPAHTQAPLHHQAQGQQKPQGNGPHGGIPYAFGQLPANGSPHDPKSHPIPGSFPGNRHAFNPKTQSFVPGSNGISPAQHSMNAYDMSGAYASPQAPSPQMAHGGYNSQQQQQPYMNVSSSYGSSREASINSMPAYSNQNSTPSKHMNQHQAVMSLVPAQMGGPMSHMQNKQGTAQASHHISSLPRHPPPTVYSSLPHYGNPATLPQKPPTGY